MSMQQLFVAVLYIAVLVVPERSRAEYILRFQNGREVLTSEYWKEDKCLLFIVDGGVAKVAENTVRDIKPVTTPPGALQAPAAEPGVTSRVEDRSASVRRDNTAGPSGSAEYDHKKRELQTQLKILLERYWNASKAQNAEEVAQLQRETVTWQKQAFDLLEAPVCHSGGAVALPGDRAR